MEKSVGEDPSLALRMTRRTGSGWQGIPGRAGNDGERAVEMMERAKEMTERKQRESSGKGEGRPDEGRRKMKEGWNNAG
jgi:hypothetical protein